MPGIDLAAITAARAELAGHEAERAALAVQRTELLTERETALRTGVADATLRRLDTQLGRIDDRRSEAERRRLDLLSNIAELSNGIVLARSPEEAVASLDGGFPVALLPVRIETRFSTDRTTLDIRIFPDQIHVDSHEEGLTEDEEEAGHWYWTLRWPAIDDATVAATGWEALVKRFRPGRARYLVDQLRPVNQPGANDPQFPEVNRRAKSWTQAPTARVLPDRWVAVGYQGDEGALVEVFRVWSDAVPDVLATGPSPEPGEPAAAGELPDDPGMKWLHDPAAAREAGMLLTVADNQLAAGHRLASGLTRLVVLGVDWTLTPDTAATALDTLLSSQAAAGGLGFVAQGTPTNNTGRARSGHRGDNDAQAAALAPTVTAPAFDAFSAGRRLAGALGLGAAGLDGVPGADLREHAWSSGLADALWEATAGYFLGEMLAPVVDDEANAALRDHAAAHLHASGPLPTLRVGAQPYGVLPVVARAGYEARDTVESDISRFAGTLRDMAAPLVQTVPHLRRAGETQDVDRTLTALLQRTPVPWSLRFRQLVGPAERKAMSVYWDRIAAFQGSYAAVLWSKLGLYTLTRLSELTMDKGDHALDVPLVRDESGTTGYLAEIKDLLTADNGVRDLTLRQNSVALLEALVAFGASQEMHRVAAKRAAEQAKAVLSTEAVATLDIVRVARVAAPYTVRIDDAISTEIPFAYASPRALTEAIIPEVSGTATMGQSITADFRKALLSDAIRLRTVTTDPDYWLGRFHDAVASLEPADPQQLEWAFRGFLDCLSTRLDAWYTSLASRRLAAIRASNPTGTHVGCYGWIEALHPDQGSAGETLGYVHTPSLAHATTAAVLRSARLAHQDANGAVFDTELTSSRVRGALTLLDGVAQGQSLAAMLGYRIERNLRERDLALAAYILPLRLQSPLQHTDAEVAEPVEAIAARDVVDGLALLEKWRTDRNGTLAAAGISTAAHRNAVAEILDGVTGLYDAVSDVLTAEAVHQTVMGNLDRAGAALGAHDRQERAPTPEVLTTPRGGHTFTNRVVLALREEGPTTGWGAHDVRGAAEPRLDAWLGHVLGRPGDYTFTAMLRRADGTSRALEPVSLKALGLGPLSVVLAAQRPGGEHPSELEALVALQMAAQVNDAAPDDHIDLLAGANGERGIAFLRTVAGFAADLLRAPALSPGDFASGIDGITGTVDIAELAARVTGALASLDSATAAVTAASTPEARVAALEECLPFAPLDALPAAASHPDAAELLAEQCARVQTRLVDLRTKVDALTATAPEPGTEATRHTGVLKTLLGEGQPVLATFTLDDPREVAASLGDRDSLLGGDDLAPLEWLHRRALVRPPLDPLGSLLTHAEADGVDIAGELSVVQLPRLPSKVQVPPGTDPPPVRWCGLPHGAAGPPEAGTIGIVLHAPGGFNPTKAMAGLVIDAWSETIPAAVETTAVAFHYDAPGARAPQAVILAVHPAASADHWDLDTLLGTVNEAVELTHLRALSAAEMAPLAPLLPALFLPDNYTRDVPSVPLRQLLDNAMVLNLTTAGSVVLGKA